MLNYICIKLPIFIVPFIQVESFGNAFSGFSLCAYRHETILHIHGLPMTTRCSTRKCVSTLENDCSMELFSRLLCARAILFTNYCEWLRVTANACLRVTALCKMNCRERYCCNKVWCVGTAVGISIGSSVEVCGWCFEKVNSSDYKQ